MKKVTSTMVAGLAGVSQGTVSMVVHNSPRISAETRQAVLRAARSLGYPLIPQNRCRNVAVIVSTDHAVNVFQSMLLSALFEEFPRHNCRMEIVSADDLAILNERIISGAVSLSGAADLNRRWQEFSGIPLVRFAQKGDPLNGIHTVYHDHADAGRKILKYLRANGHSRIGLYLRRTRNEERLLCERTGEYWIEQLGVSGIKTPGEFVSYSLTPGKNREADRAERLRRLLALGITALVVIPGESAAAILRDLAEMGIRVPEDLSVIAREYPVVFENWNPPITSFQPDYLRQAATALDMLDRALRREPVSDTAVPGFLIKRKSVRMLRTPSAGQAIS